MKYFWIGFIAMFVTAFDDTAVHIPLQSAVTRSRKGKIAFSLGLFSAICVAVVIAMMFAPILRQIPQFKTLSGIVLIVMAILVHMDVFVHEKREKMKRKVKTISWRRAAEVFGVGFAASFATVIDDVLVYTPLFAVGDTFMLLSGIITAAAIEVLLIAWAATYVSKIKYKDEIASAGLLVFGLLMITGTI